MEAESAHHPLVPLCPVCGTRRFRYLFSVERYRLVRCTDCSFSFLNPQPSNAELGAIYSQNYFLGSGDEAKESAFARLKLRTAEAYLDQLVSYSGQKTCRLLEIGSGSGAMLVAAARRGFDVTGVEYSEHACATARSRLGHENLKGEVVRGEIDAIAHRLGEFDACVMADLIEHVRDPKHFVQVVHQVLRPGGVIFIATPSLDSWSAKMMSTQWMEFKPEHLSYFSRKTLEGLLFSEGFRTLAWQPGHKILNYDYIQEHFEKFPTRFFTSAVKAVGACLPSSLRAREARVVASGMVMMGRRAEKPTRPRLSIIMPVFNEIGTFHSAFTKLLTHPFPSFDVEYLVVESNSTDGTREIVNQFARHPGVRVILEDRPRGKGHAVRTGLAAAQGDFVAIQDADLEYDLDDYDALLDPLLHNREAFVLGARHGGRAWKMRQFTGQPIASIAMNFGHWFFTTLLNVCYLVRLRDPFTMYKIFRRDCIHGLPFECNRFDFDWEIVIKLIRRGYVPVEIPVNYRSRSFKEGKKVSVIRDPLTWLRALVRFRFVRLPRWAEPVEQPDAAKVETATVAR
jgi:SAM-dependent methyltransferase